MQFGILGPLQLIRDDAPVAVPGRVLPRLIAVLLLEAGHVVPRDRLIDAVWQDRPPETAVRQILNTVSTARGLLLDSDHAEIEKIGEGYRLAVRPEQLDSLHFQSLVRLAREQVAASEPQAALASLRQALGSWRGPALAGMTGAVIEAGARRLNEERAAAVEEHARIVLDLGLSEPIIADLRRVLEAHPYRQHAAELLMTALHRADRTAEALEVHEAVRTRLAEDLGIDPGRRLRDLHTAILRDDPSLAAPTPPPPTGALEALPPPAQLPADSVHFTGRAAQMASLDRLVEAGPSTAVLSGMGGAGKSALALHWAHRNRERFPDGQLYVNLRGFDRSPPLTPLEALAGFLRALRVPVEAIPSDVEEASALLRSRLSDTRTLLVIDNARDSAQVRPLLPATGGCAAIVTSRNRLADLAALHDVIQVGVTSLAATDSLRLLAGMLGPERLEAEPAAASRLAELCAGLPLALRIVGTNLAARPEATLAETAASLSDSHRLSRLAVAGDPTTSVAAAFDLSFQTMRPEEELLYLNLALLPGADFGKDLAVALATWEPEAAEGILERLTAAHRIEQYRPGRYRFHDLVGEYARRKAEDVFDHSALQKLREQVVDWYATAGSDSLPVDEYRNIVSTFLEWNGHPTVSRLLTRLRDFAAAGYREEPSETVYELPQLRSVAERGIETGVDSPDPMDAVRAYALADSVAFAGGDLEASMRFSYKRLEFLRRTPGGDSTGIARSDLATTLTMLGRYREAVSLLREAQIAAERSGRPPVQAEVLTSLGSVLRRMGIFGEAESLLLRAKEIDAAGGGPTSVYPLLTLSELYIDTGRVTLAEEMCRLLAGMLRGSPSKYHRARLYFRQAAVHRADGESARAEAALTRGLDLVEETNSWRHQLVYTYQLAELLVDTGAVDRAREALDRVEALARYQTSETLAVRARVMCRLHTRTGDTASAIRLGRQAVDVFTALPDPLRQAQSLTSLAAAYEAAEDPEAAEACRREAAQVYSRLGLDPPQEAPAPPPAG